MNAPARPPTIRVDTLATFRAQCERVARAYAQGRATLQRVADLLEALSPLGLPADEAQRIIADAITAAEAADAADDYFGLSASFARLCRAADAEAKEQKRFTAQGESVPHVPASTMMAARFLIQKNDPARFETWLAEHDARERAAICAAIDNDEPPAEGEAS